MGCWRSARDFWRRWRRVTARSALPSRRDRSRRALAFFKGSESLTVQGVRVLDRYVLFIEWRPPRDHTARTGRAWMLFLARGVLALFPTDPPIVAKKHSVNSKAKEPKH